MCGMQCKRQQPVDQEKRSAHQATGTVDDRSNMQHLRALTFKKTNSQATACGSALRYAFHV